MIGDVPEIHLPFAHDDPQRFAGTAQKEIGHVNSRLDYGDLLTCDGNANLVQHDAFIELLFLDGCGGAAQWSRAAA